MNQALLVVNFNHALCDNSRASMQAAAKRWAADFVELEPGFFKNGTKPKVHPAALKCFCFQLTNHDEYFILDADTVVSANCPSPFETFYGPKLVVVHNGSERFGDLPQIRGCECFEWEKLKREESRMATCVYSPGIYFNSGMMLAKRQYHNVMFDLAAGVCLTDHGCGWIDQTQLNMAAQITGVELHFADESWNYIHPGMLGGGWLNMRSTGKYIYHGAGEPERINWLPAVIWR